MRVKRVVIDKAIRLQQSPPDILSTLQSLNRRSLLKKQELIDLASFNWPIAFDKDQLPKPNRLGRANDDDLRQLREAVADWMFHQHRVKLNPEKEIYIGGSVPHLLFTIGLAFLDPGDVTFVPDLADPLYRRTVIACGAEPVGYAVAGKDNWLPRFDLLSSRLGRVARLLFINSPHNPTGARLTEKHLSELVWLAARENIIVVNDAQFQSLSNEPSVSLLTAEGGKRVGVEVYSLPCLLGIPEMPLGCIVGNKEVIAGVRAASSMLANYVTAHSIDLALEAIHKFPAEPLLAARKQIQQSAMRAERIFESLSLENAGQPNVPFLWAKITRHRSSLATARFMQRRGRVLVAPGSTFGNNGEGYLRFSLTATPADYQKAAVRLKNRIGLLSKEEKDER